MLTAIQFDGQFCLRAIKIEIIWADGMLAAKREIPQLPVTKVNPKSDLMFGHRTAEFSRARRLRPCPGVSRRCCHSV